MSAAIEPPIRVPPIRVAYTVEQSWHPVPGGTAVAAVRIGRELRSMADQVELHYVAGRHPDAPELPLVIVPPSASAIPTPAAPPGSRKPF